jgi:tRNA (pseudouridine54-N1)-methyltransferase
MSEFILYVNRKLNPNFSLNDLPGSGRADLIARCVSSALWLSHSVRREAVIRIFFSKNKRAVSFYGNKIKRISPDERNIASWIKKALASDKKVNPGIETQKTDFKNFIEKLEKRKIYILSEKGEDIRKLSVGENPVFVLGDHLDLPDETIKVIEKYNPQIVSVGPKSYLASHCIVLVHNELDRNQQTY